MKVSVLTLGCKANQSESSVIEATLRTRGCEIVGLEEGPDFCVINTCSVTSKSDYQSRQIIRRAAKSGSRVIVTGCYSELNKPSVQSMDGVLEVVDIDKKDIIAGILAPEISSSALCLCSPSRSRFFLKVQDGCNYSCSYCIIPAARGRSRSLPVEEVLEQTMRVSDTYAEVVLTGIHLGTYGYDLNPKVSLAGLLSSILLRTKIRRVRLSSLEIREVDGKLTDLLQERRVCSHLHIPLQSGDDRILGLMNRGYTSRQFRDCVLEIAGRIPGIAIGTDVIAGFPSEAEGEFRNTLNMLESLPFTYVHVFPFSPRKGTRAAEMPGGIASAAKKRRCAAVRALGVRKKAEYMKAQMGRTLDLLVEEIGSDGTCVGTTGNYLKVRAPGSIGRPKDIVAVRIADVAGDVLIGHAIPGV